MICQKSKKSLLNTWEFLLIIMILFFCSSTSGYALNVSFQWDKNTDPDIAGYRVFCREEGRSYDYTNPSWEGTSTSCSIYNLDETKTYFFVVRDFNKEGLESIDSNELCLEAATTSNNQPPKAVIVQNYIEANPGDTVALDGSSSTDADDGIASYLWSQMDGTPVTVSDQNAKIASFIAPETDQYGSNLSFNLTVTDFGGLQSTATCLVYVTNEVKTDNVTVTSATYVQRRRRQRIVVKAVSDAPEGSVTLTVWANYGSNSTKLGDLRYSASNNTYSNTFRTINSTPDSITVTSSGGGEDTLACTIK